MDMKIYRSGAEVNLFQPIVNYDDEAIYPTSATYRVEDEDGVEILADTAITFEPDDTEIQLVIDAAHNTLAVDDWTKMRVVIIKFVTDGHDFIYTHRYIVRQGDRLAEWTNSFQTFNSATMFAFDITRTPGWDHASEEERKTALIEAYNNIVKLKFSGVAFDTIGDWQSYDGGMSFFNEGFYLTSLEQTQIDDLSADFVEALKRAQIYEADYLLGGETVEDKRRTGLMSETIGESSNMFRPGKPLVMIVSNRALKALTGYIEQALSIGRG